MRIRVVSMVTAAALMLAWLPWAGSFAHARGRERQHVQSASHCDKAVLSSSRSGKAEPSAAGRKTAAVGTAGVVAADIHQPACCLRRPFAGEAGGERSVSLFSLHCKLTA